MNGDEKNFFEAFRDDIIDYLHARARLTKIEAYEKLSKLIGVVFSFVIILTLFGFVIIFTGLMLGYLLAALTHSNAIGFSIVAFVFIISLVIMVVKRKEYLEKPITEKMVDALFEEEESFSQPRNNEPS